MINRLTRKNVALLVIDVQEKLFPFVENSCAIIQVMQKAILGFQILKIPIFVTEQYPKGLGGTLPVLKGILSQEQHYLQKTAFSCLASDEVKEILLNTNVTDFVVIGIEAHVCVLQTVKDLLEAGKKITVLNDAIGSRSIYDFSTAIAEMRDSGARISSTETVLFELLRDSKAPEFKAISELIKH